MQKNEENLGKDFDQSTVASGKKITFLEECLPLYIRHLSSCTIVNVLRPLELHHAGLSEALRLVVGTYLPHHFSAFINVVTHYHNFLRIIHNLTKKGKLGY